MMEGNAAGRKTEVGFVHSMEDVLDRSMQSMRAALGRAEEDTNKYDGYGRLRDREIANAVRLGDVSAKLAAALHKLRREERENKNREK